MSSPPGSRPYPLLFFVTVLVGAAALAFVVLRPFSAAIGWAVVLAVAIWPLWLRVRTAFGSRRSLAAVLLSVATALVVLLPGALLGAAIAGQAVDALSRVAGELRSRNVASFGDLVAQPRVAQALEWVQQKTGITPDDLRVKAAEVAAQASRFVAAAGGGLVAGFVDALVTFVVTMFLLFFFLRDGEGMAEAAVGLIPVEAEERKRLRASLGTMLQAIFRGSLVCALVQGITGGIGWAIGGLPSAVLAGAAMAVLSLLPIGGTALVWLPGAIVCWVEGRHGAAIFLFLWGLIVVSFLADNVLKPILIGGRGELSTLVVFLGVFGGIAAFGLLGIFIGPMALAVAIELVRTLSAAAQASREPGPSPPTAAA